MAREYVFDSQGNRIAVLRGTWEMRLRKLRKLAEKHGNLLTMQLPKISERKKPSDSSFSFKIPEYKTQKKYRTTFFDMKGKKLKEVWTTNPDDFRFEAIRLSSRYQTDVKYLDASGFWDFQRFEKSEPIPADCIKFWDYEDDMNQYIEDRTGIPVPEKDARLIGR